MPFIFEELIISFKDNVAMKKIGNYQLKKREL